MSSSTTTVATNPKQLAIIEATSRLIAEKGVENTSLADIAREVEISKGTLYYYYASKSDLLFDVTEHHFQKTTEGLLDWVSNVKDQSDPREIFKVVFETIVGDKTRGRLHVYLLQSITHSNPQLRERFQQKYQEWQLMIQVGLTAIFGENEEFEALAALILAALDGFVVQAHLGIETIPVDGIVEWLATRLDTPAE